MKINSNQILKNLRGENLKAEDGDATLGAVLASILVNDEAGGKMKLYILATKFMEQDSVELDAADLAMVKTAVERTRLNNALVTGQILLILDGKTE